MTDTLINWHRAACTCEGEDRCIHCQTVAALTVKNELLQLVIDIAPHFEGTDAPFGIRARTVIAKATAA